MRASRVTVTAGVCLALAALVAVATAAALSLDLDLRRGATSSSAAARAADADPSSAPVGAPNIVMIMVDDMRQDDLRFMPATTRLIAGQGVTFSNSFAPHPLGSPARASVLTGRYTHNHGIYNGDPPYGFAGFDDSSTLATWLADAGYTTSFIGEYLSGYGAAPAPGTATPDPGYVPPGWSQWAASFGGSRLDPEDDGIYRYFAPTLSRDGRGPVRLGGSYATELFGSLSEEAVRSAAPAAEPFFLWTSYTAPHYGSPVEADDPDPVRRQDGERSVFPTPARPAAVRGSFDDLVTEAPGRSWSDPDFGDKPEFLRTPPVSEEEWAALLEVTRQRAEALSVVDQQVERTLTALEETGELDRTVVLFTSDNGYLLGEQRVRRGKALPYEPSLRVPLLVRGPGIPPGQVRSDPFTAVDVAPTLADAAGVPPAGPVDGVSLLEVARHYDRGWSRAVLTETGPREGLVRVTDAAGGELAPGEDADVRFALGIRTERYLYVDLASGEEELYDLLEDPAQYHNLLFDPEEADVLALLREELQRMRTCAGAACAAPMTEALVAGN